MLHLGKIQVNPYQLLNRATILPYFSTVYLAKFKYFENFEKSNEFDIFTGTLPDIFPYGLDYKWYVQYQIIRSYKNRVKLMNNDLD